MGLGVELVGWWAAAVGVWLASLSAWSVHDFVVAAGCAVPCAALAVAARRAVRGAWRPPRHMARAAALLPVSLVCDFGRVLAASWRPRRARQMGFRSTRLPVEGKAAQRAGQRAFASVLLSATPGSYVVDVDADGTALLHSAGQPTATERSLTR